MGRGGAPPGGRGRGRHRRGDYSPLRSANDGGSTPPPSRHLWVGNLSSHVTENVLSEQFLRFGDLDSISYLPGRTYAFVNFRKEEDAVMAMRALHGAVVAGSSLNIEFQKADKTSSDGGYGHLRGERHSVERGDPIIRKDPLQNNMYETCEGDKSAEPSEVLWIGFPATLHVDEMILGRAFAPFGEIDKITTFPGRTYAFVRYTSVVAACRAKEALQGNLFNNPRVSICFAHSDASPDYGRHSLNPSSRFNQKTNLPPILGERFGESARHDRDFGGPLEDHHRPSRFFSDMERHPRDAGVPGISRNGLLGMDTRSGSHSDGALEPMRSQRLGRERKIPEDPYDHFRHDSPFERDLSQHDISIERRPRGSHFEDPWNVEDVDFPSSKKIRLDTYPDRELPEYPFSDFQTGAEHAAMTKYRDLPERQMNKSRFDSMPLGYKGYPEKPKNITHPHKSDEFWRSSDAYDAGPGSLHPDATKQQRPSLEGCQPLKDEWKWEGTIAKGGTPICRARCFPVGKVLDMMLPEFLDCTARTGLDMLAKHFYQAACSWVVFFVPETDADIAFYNEFMNYLGEKQRAAVAKLGEKTTLFLVPPSDFSEQVLKVPGKMSISGVVLRFRLGNPSLCGPPRLLEASESDAPPYTPQARNRINFDDSLKAKRISPDFRDNEEHYVRSSSGNFVSLPGFPKPSKLDGNTLFSTHAPPMEKMPDSAGDDRYDHIKRQKTGFPPNWLPPDARVPITDFGNIPSSVSNASSHLIESNTDLEYSAPRSNYEQGVGPIQYIPAKPNSLLDSNKISTSQESKTPFTSSTPLPTLQPEQLAQLAVLLDQQKRPAKDPVALSDGSQKELIPSEQAGFHAHNPAVDASTSQFVKANQLQLPNVQTPNLVVPMDNQGTQQVRSNAREEAETDPQKRLQATLQLAATLLQQIQVQQQSKSDQH